MNNILLNLWVSAQIILESLPISSSGHVQLMFNILQKCGIDTTLPADHWIIDFFLHGFTILILMTYFFKQWWWLIVGNPIKPSSLFNRSSWDNIFQAGVFICIADGITVIFWATDLLPKIPLVVGFMITALLLYSLKILSGQRNFDHCYQNAILLGIMQGFSLISGISRFATTFATSRHLGYSNPVAFALCFLIQMPLIIAGFLKSVIALWSRPELTNQLFTPQMILVMIVATTISYFALWLVGKIIEKKSLWKFSWYMIIPIMLSMV